MIFCGFDDISGTWLCIWTKNWVHGLCWIILLLFNFFFFTKTLTFFFFFSQQILHAVYTIHEERIVHSDLKPANFLLVKGSLKLIDFGIAKAIMSDTTNIQRDAQVLICSWGNTLYLRFASEKDIDQSWVGAIGRVVNLLGLGYVIERKFLPLMLNVITLHVGKFGFHLGPLPFSSPSTFLCKWQKGSRCCA